MTEKTKKLPTWSFAIIACVLAVAVVDNSLAAYSGRTSRIVTAAIYASGFAIAVFGLYQSWKAARAI